MVPSLTLRNVPETTNDLNLDRLLSFLEAHFEEKAQLTFEVSSLLWPSHRRNRLIHLYGDVLN